MASTASGGGPEQRASAPRSPPLPPPDMKLDHHVPEHVRQYQPTASRKVPLDPGGGRDIRKSSGTGIVGLGRQNSESSLEQMMHRHQSMMDFNNMKMPGDDDYSSMRFGNGGNNAAVFNSMLDPLIGASGGGSDYFGDPLMTFPSARRFHRRRGTIAHIEGGADDFAVGLGAPKHKYHRPEQQMSFADETTDLIKMVMMDDTLFRPSAMGGTTVPYQRLDDHGGMMMGMGPPSLHHVKNTSNSGSKAQQQQAFIMQVQSRQSNKKRERAPSSTSFPVKLYKILSDPKYRHVITWLPHGRAWRILKPKAFEEDIIPKFFRSDRYASFMRQVNGWGFKRITEGPDLNSYYHEMFLRGLPKIAAKMRRPQKGDLMAIPSNKEFGQYPDFYKISLFAPLPMLDGKSEGDNGDKKSQKASADVVENKSAQLNKQHQECDEEAPLTPRETMIRPTSSEAEQSPVSAAGTEVTSSPKIKIRSSDAKDDHRMNSTGCGPNALKMFHSPGRHPIPTVDMSENHAQSHLSSPGVAGANELVGMTATSPGSASIHSWNEPRDQDLSTWADSPGYGAYPSPADRHSLFISSFNAPSKFFQVTPPSQQHSSPNGGGGGRKMPRVPYQPYRGDGNEGSSLSAADLCYLTEQNRILLQDQGSLPK